MQEDISFKPSEGRHLRDRQSVAAMEAYDRMIAEELFFWQVQLSNVGSKAIEPLNSCRVSVLNLLLHDQPLIKVKVNFSFSGSSTNYTRPPRLQQFFGNLNQEQNQAVQQSIERAVILITGPSGTGETHCEISYVIGFLSRCPSETMVFTSIIN